jgi:hypothetical protein
MTRTIVSVMAVVLAVLLTPLPSSAVEGQPAASTSSCASPPPPGPPSVIEVQKFGHSGEKDPDRSRAAIRDLIVLKVKALCLLIDQAKCLGPHAGVSCKPQDIVLYLEGREIKGLAPESGAPRADIETLQFRLDRSDKSDAQWADLLGNPKVGERFFDREVAVSVGLQNDGPIPTRVQKFTLIRIHKWRFWICGAILLLAVAGIGVLGRYSALLRYADKTSSFSLARCQMAFWFMLVVAAFSFIWLITGAVDIITNTALVLIGIGAGTALGGKVIDRAKEQGTKTELENSKVTKEKLAKQIENLDKRAQVQGITDADKLKLDADKGEKEVLHAAAATKEDELVKKLQVAKSGGFWTDILSDGDNIRFDRFQIVVWTAILGVVFLNSVWARLAMPEFDATLLTLMGISSGTYLGFKIPDR